MSEQTPRIRRQAIPDDAQLIVRGDEDPDVQERMARAFLRRYPSWGRFGLSGYHATGDEDVDLLCRVELIRFLSWWCSPGLNWSRPSRSCRPATGHTSRLPLLTWPPFWPAWPPPLTGGRIRIM